MRHPAFPVITALALPAAPAFAAPAPDTRAVDALDKITVTATLIERALGAELAGRFARGKDVPTVGSGAAANPAHAPAGYGVFELLLHREVAPGFRIDAGVFDLAGRRYFGWADVPLLAANTASSDRYSAPGRSVSLNLRLDG